MSARVLSPSAPARQRARLLSPCITAPMGAERLGVGPPRAGTLRPPTDSFSARSGDLESRRPVGTELAISNRHLRIASASGSESDPALQLRTSRRSRVVGSRLVALSVRPRPGGARHDTQGASRSRLRRQLPAMTFSPAVILGLDRRLWPGAHRHPGQRDFRGLLAPAGRLLPGRQPPRYRRADPVQRRWHPDGDRDRDVTPHAGAARDRVERPRGARRRAGAADRSGAQGACTAAEASNRAKDEFLAMLAHELRTPLSAIATAAHSLERLHGRDAASVPVEVINRQVRHVTRLVDDLLDAGRVMAGKILIDRQPIDLADIIGRSIDALAAARRLERHDLAVHLVPAWVDADADRMEQVIVNLLTNALKYTPPGGSVTVALEHEHANVVLKIEDDGIGIPPELLPRVFDSVRTRGEGRLRHARRTWHRARAGQAPRATARRHCRCGHSGPGTGERVHRPSSSRQSSAARVPGTARSRRGRIGRLRILSFSPAVQQTPYLRPAKICALPLISVIQRAAFYGRRS